MANLSTLDESVPAGQDNIGNGPGGVDDASRQRGMREAVLESFGAEHHLEGPHQFPTATSVSGKTTNALTLDTTNGVLFLGNDVFSVGSVRTLCWSEEYYHFAGFIMQTAAAKSGSGPGFAVYTTSRLEARTELPAGTYETRASFRYYSSTSGGSIRVKYSPDGSSFSLQHTLSVTSASAYSTTTGVTASVDSTVASFTLASSATVHWRIEPNGNANLGVCGGGLQIRRTG